MHKITFYFFFIIVLLFIPGCRKERHNKETLDIDSIRKQLAQEQAKYEKINTLYNTIMTRFNNRSPDKLESQYGTFSLKNEEPAKSPHSEKSVGSLYTLQNDNITVTLYHFKDTGNHEIQKLELTGNDIELASGIRIGMAREEVISILGNEFLENNDRLVFEAFLDIPQPRPDGIFIFYLNEQNFVTKITFERQLFT